MPGAGWEATLWCHHCGVYSFREEWGDSGLGLGGYDHCPHCGEIHPGMQGPLVHDPESAFAAAVEEIEVWS